jgi:hypothetical protein
MPTLDEVIREAAVKHGVGLTKDDPVLLIVTIVDLLARDLDARQAERLAEFQRQIEASLSRVVETATVSAERGLGAAVDAARGVIGQEGAEAGKAAGASVVKAVGPAVEAIGAAVERVRVLALLAAGSAVVGMVCVALSVILFART